MRNVCRDFIEMVSNLNVDLELYFILNEAENCSLSFEVLARCQNLIHVRRTVLCFPSKDRKKTQTFIWNTKNLIVNVINYPYFSSRNASYRGRIQKRRG